MTAPEECPECGTLAFLDGRCGHCDFEVPTPPPAGDRRSIGLRGVAESRRQLRTSREEH